MDKSRWLSIGLGIAAGVGVCYALDRFGSGVNAQHLLPKRAPNPGEAIEPDEIIPPSGRRGRIPSQAEDLMRGLVRAGVRVWVDRAGKGWEYVAQEWNGRAKPNTPQGPIIEIDPSTASRVRIKK